MKVIRLTLLLPVLLVLASALSAQQPAADPAEIWKAISQPVSDGSRAANVSNLTLQRDRIRITLLDGNLVFMQAANGVYFGAEFHGRGRVQVDPPNANERQQLRLFASKDTLDMQFSQAVFVFTDGTYEEIARQVKWEEIATSGSATYLERQQDREDKAGELLPRLLKNILADDQKRNAIFAADLDTADKGWIHVRHDALEIEEVFVGKWARRGAWFTLEPWMSFPAGGQASPAYRDPLIREDFLVRSYDLQATAGEDELLTVTARVDLQHRVAGERVALFVLDANLRVASVKDSQGQPLVFFQPRDPKFRDQSYGDYVAVVLQEKSRAGGSQTIEFQYSGKRVIRRVGQGNYFCQSFGWYPAVRNAFAARSDFQMNFRYPARFSLVATGTKVSEGPFKSLGGAAAMQGQWNTSTWKSDIPLAVAGFAFGNYKIHTEKAGDVTVDIYANKDPDDNIQSLLTFLDDPVPGRRAEVPGANIGTMVPAAYVKTMGAELANSVRTFEKYFGPYPYKHLAMTNIPYSYGQGWPGLIYLSFLSFLDSTQRNALRLKDHMWLSDFWRAHEASHQWWGHRVGWKTYRDQWLSEGFAQFSGNLYVHLRNQMKDYLVRIRKDKEELLARGEKGHVYESLGPISMGWRLSSTESERGYDMVVYRKGGLVLHMLRMMLFDPGNAQNPEHRFMAMMQEFCRTFENKPASTDDFQAVVEKYMTPAMDLDGNRKMDWFFRQYVHSTGIPEYTFRYSTDTTSEPGKFKISGTIVQNGVSEGWKDILPIYIQTEGRVALLGWTRATQRISKVEFTLPINPQKVILNHYEDVIATVKQ